MKHARIALSGLAAAAITLTASPLTGQSAPASQSTPTSPPAASGQAASAGGQEYDFLIKGGRVIDARNSLDAVRDVAIKDGKIETLQLGFFHRPKRGFMYYTVNRLDTAATYADWAKLRATARHGPGSAARSAAPAPAWQRRHGHSRVEVSCTSSR